MKLTTIAMLALVACGGSSATPDATSGAPDAAPTCQDLVDRYQALTGSLSRQCDVDGDCVALGGKAGGDPTCDCAPALPDDAVNSAAYQTSDLPAIQDAFYAQCTDPAWFGDCDASPVMAHCSNHVCVATTQSCLDFDAGP